MKDLVLINPMSSDLKTIVNPVGLQIIEAIMRQKEYDVEILDLSYKMYKEQKAYEMELWNWIESKILTKESRIYGISIMNGSFPWAIRIAEIIKVLFPKSIIFVGGSQATALKDAIFEETEAIDYVLPYEGERTVPNFVSYIYNGGEIPLNVIGKNGVSGKIEMTYEDINQIPKLDYTQYTDLPLLDVEVGRGCAYNCYYCSAASLNGRKVRYKEIDKILDEAEETYLLLDFKKTHIVNFGHDNFLSFKSVFKKFANQKIEKGYTFRYGCEGRIDHIDDEIIELLSASGCEYLFVGLETGSKRMQEICRKRLDLTNVEGKIKKITDCGISMEANFIIGFPEERLQDLYDTIIFATKIAQVSHKFKVDYSYISPEPCTEIYESTSTEDYILVKDEVAYLNLLHCGFDMSKLSARHFNNLYTRKNDSYNIIEYIKSARVYFVLLRRFYVTTFLLLNKGYEACELFEAARYFSDISSMVLYYKNNCSFLEIEKQLIEFELDIYCLKTRKNHTIDKIYKFPVQSIYRQFLKEKKSYDTWESIGENYTHIIKR